jgi:kynurenine formamidase
MAAGALPQFAELPVHKGAPPGSSWGVFGEGDELGTLNFIGPEQVRAAAELVRTGRVFALNWDVALPAPPFFMRQAPKHTIFEKFDGVVLDDWLDSFYLQGSTQWDGLRHFSDAEYGWYSGATRADVSTTGPGRLGIEHLARRGIAARGVLLDVARALERDGVELDPFDFFPIGPELLERVAEVQGVALRAGDVLLVRTGWVEAYERLDQGEREQLAAAGRPGSPGLYGEELPAFLWNRGIAAVAADNPALEAAHPGTGSDLSLHKALLARLGMPLGELWVLAPLAADCAADGVFECFLTSAPLNVGGGAGSPANALAVK